MSNITLLGDQIPSAPPAQKTHTRRLYGMSTRGDVGADSHAPSIVASCKQTRFHTIESTSSAEVTVLPEIPPSVARQLPLTSPTIQLSVEGLSISILPSKSVTKKSVAKSKAPATTRAVEILADADLKLKGGVRYGLLGRNGTGKSTLLRAIAEKLIPGLPSTTKVSILQQTSEEDQGPLRHGLAADRPADSSASGAGKTVLQHVIGADVARAEVLHHLSVLTQDVRDDEDDLGRLHAYRRFKHEQLREQYLDIEKNARLRSGARGSQARKDLISFEKRLGESKNRLQMEAEELKLPEVRQEIRAASELMVELQTQLDSMSLLDLEVKARGILRGLGFKEPDLQKPLRSLSGGWTMRCMLACVLFQDADIMILDEPTNFLDLFGIIWLQKYLIQLRTNSSRTVLLVSHDRDFIDNVCEEIVLMKDKSLAHFKGNLTEYEDDLRSRRINLTRMKEAQDRQAAHMEKTVRDNIKLGKKTGDDNKLRQAVSRQKRLDDRSGLQVSATGSRFKLSRDMTGFHLKKRADIEIPPDEKSVSFSLPVPPELRFPGPLISLERVQYRYAPKQQPVLDDLDLIIHMGDRVGVIGLNGSGKSTLIKLVTDAISPTRGLIARHPRLRIGYHSQHAVEELRQHGHGASGAGRTALQLLSAEAGDDMTEQEMLRFLGSLGLSGRTALDVPVEKLSGGQLARLALARILWTHPHLLVLDEVTTHLDFYTVKALAKALVGFNGALLLVSHDRFLMKYVIEGEDPSNADDSEGEEEADANANASESRRMVYVVKDRKLKVETGGVSSFEQALEKRAAKLWLGG